MSITQEWYKSVYLPLDCHARERLRKTLPVDDLREVKRLSREYAARFGLANLQPNKVQPEAPLPEASPQFSKDLGETSSQESLLIGLIEFSLKESTRIQKEITRTPPSSSSYKELQSNYERHAMFIRDTLLKLGIRKRTKAQEEASTKAFTALFQKYGKVV